MKESTLYFNFLKTNFIFFLFLGLAGLCIGYYQVTKLPTYFISEKLYEFPYNLSNAVAVEKISEQAVTVMRAPQLKEMLGLQSSQITVYKPGPFSVILQTKDINPEKAVYNLSLLAGYFSQKYQVSETGKEVFLTEEKPVKKYLLLGFLSGEIVGLLASLIVTYFKKY